MSCDCAVVQCSLTTLVSRTRSWKLQSAAARSCNKQYCGIQVRGASVSAAILLAADHRHFGHPRIVVVCIREWMWFVDDNRAETPVDQSTEWRWILEAILSATSCMLQLHDCHHSLRLFQTLHFTRNWNVQAGQLGPCKCCQQQGLVPAIRNVVCL